MTTPAALDLGALFDGATRSVVRVETLGAYRVPSEAAELAAWRNGAAITHETPDSDTYLARVAAAAARGVTWERLRVIDTPLTEYQRWELEVFELNNQPAGERVIVAQRHRLAWNPEFEDTWRIDDVVVGIDYDREGGYVGRHLSDLTGALDNEGNIRRVGIPLDTFLARRGAARAS